MGHRGSRGGKASVDIRILVKTGQGGLKGFVDSIDNLHRARQKNGASQGDPPEASGGMRRSPMLLREQWRHAPPPGNGKAKSARRWGEANSEIKGRMCGARGGLIYTR